MNDASETGPTLLVHVRCGGIGEAGSYAPIAAGWSSVDAIAVGHYAKVEPQFAELALGVAISSSLGPSAATVGESAATDLITDFTRRGIIQGELGVPFFLPDPRDNGRVIAIAGMGSVGCFGAPELTFLVWQILWALARLGRKHLATVLIGAGAGNLDSETAVSAWMDGVALAAASASGVPPLECLTFIESVPEKAEQIRSALLSYQGSAGIPRLDISVTPSTAIPISTAPAPTARIQAPATPAPHAITRIWAERRGKKYWFGSLSDQASHVRDYTNLDHKTIFSANDELAAKEIPDHQRKAAKYLFNLLIPQSLRGEFSRKDPIVIECDNTTAQLHWEMMVVPHLQRYRLGDSSAFLGMHPTITRQFRNSFGQPPEPPPRTDRTLRVLIVADTDDTRSLPDSREEANAIQALFGKYEGSVSVEALVGPESATYDSVLEHLFKYPPYDVLHFSGHCEYVEDDPPRSGWLFSKGNKITAYELTRVDCVPGFVFSNACDSGEMPEQVTRRAVPSFAEAFFQRGVKNFVCTAWPVASKPARDFACSFYKELLGVEKNRAGYMYEAMRAARKSIWKMPHGERTWGAYQHYGNPWFRLV